MINKVIFTIFFILLSKFSVFSEELMVEYMQETVEVKDGTEWTGLETGDELDINATIRVKAGGMIELAADKYKISISENGTYSLEELADHSQQVAAWGLDTALSSKLGTLLGNDNVDTEASAMGVRADNAGEEESLFEDYESIVRDGIINLQQGEYNTAIENFTDALDYVYDEDEEKWVRYNIAAAYMQKGQYILSQMELMDVAVEPSEDYFPGYVILQGNLHLYAGNFSDAEKLFDTYFKKVKDKKNREHQTVCFLASISSRGQNDEQSAIRLLKKAKALQPSSTIGRAATELLSKAGK